MNNPPKFTKFVVEDKNFLWMPLNDDVKRRNVASYMLAYFGLVCVASMNLDFFSFLLEDNLAITGGDAADVISKVSLVCTIVILSFQVFIGAAMDLVGRKLPTIIGLTICGLCILLMPVSTTLVGLYFLRIFASIGILPASMSPYAVDYIKAESLGVL